MYKRKIKRIEQTLARLEENLANAEQYVLRNVNVEGRSFLHFGDWRGNSGHPLWMKNHMIPRTKMGRARMQRALRRIENEAKDRDISIRRRAGIRSKRNGVVDVDYHALY